MDVSVCRFVWVGAALLIGGAAVAADVHPPQDMRGGGDSVIVTPTALVAAATAMIASTGVAATARANIVIDALAPAMSQSSPAPIRISVAGGTNSGNRAAPAEAGADGASLLAPDAFLAGRGAGSPSIAPLPHLAPRSEKGATPAQGEFAQGAFNQGALAQGALAQGALAQGALAQGGHAAPRPAPKFRSERDAFRTGIREYNSGDMASAVSALEYAATHGHASAQWKLGRMYAEGDGVGHDDLKAFEYFSRVIEGAQDGGGRMTSRLTSNAYVALGGYYLDGIAGTYVNKDEQRARELFQHAASYYGDPDAQYNLARLCLKGQGGARDARLAARWLHLAAEKNHSPSQALLGHLLLTGQGNVTRQPPRGLMWLTIARNGADPQKDAWIIEMYDQAIALVSESDRSSAKAYLDQRSRN